MHTKIAPAPWHLTGDGYILIYRFPESFVVKHGFLPPKPAYWGGLGAVMLVDYNSSPVGPYHELLFIPGLFRRGVGLYYSITRIFVSTAASVHNGRENWGIPKDLAAFDVQKTGLRAERVIVRQSDQIIADITLDRSALGLPALTGIVPGFLRTLLQIHEGRCYITTPGGRGTLQPAQLVSAQINSDFFPDFTRGHLLGAVTAQGFSLTFPEARISKA